MDISKLQNFYPLSGTFVFATGDELSITWNADVFSSSFEQLIAEERARSFKPLQDKLENAQIELEALREKKKDVGDEEDSDLDARLQELTESFKSFSSELETAERAFYADLLAGKVLLGWDMKDGDKPVLLASEPLKALPLLFLKDLLQWAREESLPKWQRVAGTGASPTTSATTSSGSRGSGIIQTREDLLT
jgi:hypothetical protein